jgi:hypothetical protein
MMNSETLYFYVPGNDNLAPRLVDQVIEDASGVRRGVYSSKTLDELQAKYPGLATCTSGHYNELARQAARTPPVEIERGEFDHLLGCLPPEGWVNRGDGESFKLIERYTLDITIICARIGQRYFKLRDSAELSHEDILAAISRAGLVDHPSPAEEAEPANFTP